MADETASPHVPVLLDEVLEHLAVGPGQRIYDGTVGAGGHSRALLARVGPDGLVLGVDRDRRILPYARRSLEAIGGRYHLAWGLLSELGVVAERFGVAGRLDAVLFDLGVSSLQLDDSGRGFSFDRDGPLDFRMGRGADRPAHEVVQRSSATELEKIFAELGEEPRAREVAEAIVRERSRRPILRTRHLAQVVESVLPRRGKLHPATRIFQAIRITVNRELDELAAGIEAALGELAPGGRLGIVSFHSLEDRIVKQAFRDASRTDDFRLVMKGAVTPSSGERRRNRRSRSAKLRVIQRA